MSTRTAPSRRARTVAILVVGIAVLLACNAAIYAASRHTFHSWYIPSEAMKPTLEIGDRIETETLSYELHDPHRGDIVVFDLPSGAASPQVTTAAQRIVGLPGEEIEGRDGAIFIDGRRLDESYLPRDVRSRTFGPEHIPEDGYFVLGDNRQYSKDSTFYGPIARDAIVGRAFLRIAPPSRIGIL